ncbi:LysR family transcriptional regulator [Halomonas huangheensis]|uniref:LysR family transcriptional regulator n=1 Tax=Halomonas huangheensis TaxID=1178482 RepID=W1N1A2_9GAMM|nr:LysR family transcriptional regulator [Halomonas huangheensis]ALM52396.1 LysR family transcriptional regulator [Halomonas huangheensis]ERL49342.1 LysR family transcriptional regulator [Halomonas huangheensis]
MSNDVSLVALRLFVRVAATGSFAAAARQHGLPASSVSRHIAALEKALGQRLLYRHTRAVRLTEVGEQYYQTVREVLDTLDIATEQVQGAATEPRGLLRINAPVAFGRLHVAPRLAAFQARYPDIETELTLTDAFIDPVQEGVDIVLRVGVLRDSSLVARKLADQHFVACASPAYIAEHGRPRTPEELRLHNCLVYKGSRGVQRWYFRDPNSHLFRSHEVRGNLRSNNAESLREAALQGQGIILFPTWLIHDDISGQRLTSVLEEWEASGEPEPQGIHAIFPENRLRSSKVAAFLTHLQQAIGEVPYWDG